MIFNTEEFLSHYLEAVEFTDFGEEGQPERGSKFSKEALETAKKDCQAFIDTAANHGLLDEFIQKGGTVETFAHDFWFTRNHHGVGFWDKRLGGLGEQLTRLAQKFSEVCCYEGDDSLVYFG